MKLVIDESTLAGLAAELDVEVHHPVITPNDPAAWMLHLLGGALVATEDRATSLGWPFVLAHGVVATADGTILEHRVGAFYRFFHFAAALVVRCVDAQALSSHLSSFVELAISARPDFRSEQVLALATLWGESLPILN